MPLQAVVSLQRHLPRLDPGHHDAYLHQSNPFR